jgi:hypothetical protein
MKPYLPFPLLLLAGCTSWGTVLNGDLINNDFFTNGFIIAAPAGNHVALDSTDSFFDLQNAETGLFNLADVSGTGDITMGPYSVDSPDSLASLLLTSSPVGAGIAADTDIPLLLLTPEKRRTQLPRTHGQSVLLAYFGIVCIVLSGYTYYLGGQKRFEVYALDFAAGAFLSSLAYVLIFGGFERSGPAVFDNLAYAQTKAIFLGVMAASVWGVGTFFFIAASARVGVTFVYSVAVGLGVSVGAGIPLLIRCITKPSVYLAVLILAILMMIASAAVCLVSYVEAQPPQGQVKRTFIPLGTPVSIFTIESPTTRALIPPISTGLLWAAFLPLSHWSQENLELGGLLPYSVGLLVGDAVAIVGLAVCGRMLYIGRLRLRDLVCGPVPKRLLGFLGGTLSTTGVFGILVCASVPAFGAGSEAATTFLAPFLGALLGFILCKEFPPAVGGRRRLAWIMLSLQWTAPLLVWLGAAKARW